MYKNDIDFVAKNYTTSNMKLRFHGNSIEDFGLWQKDTRNELIKLTGMDKCITTKPNFTIRKAIEKDGYTENLCDIETEPGMKMPLYLLKPNNIEGRIPAIILPHGHSLNGKEDVAHPQKGENFALTFVKKGYCVFCPDARGAGERMNKEYIQLTGRSSSSHRVLSNLYLGRGQALIGLMVWDLMRLVDYIESLSYIDNMRIGCAGMSGGGQQTLWLAAMDDRIRAASTSGYFYGMLDALLRQPENCACNFVHGIWGLVDMGDLGALIAPRPFHVESGKADHLNGLRGIVNVTEQLSVTKYAYRIFDAENSVHHCIHEHGHVWLGTGLLDFFSDAFHV